MLLIVAALIICAAVGGLGSEATQVFLRAFALSSGLSLLPVAILWFLDRREREKPWLFAAAFLWGGLIATAFALPANTAAIMAIAGWRLSPTRFCTHGCGISTGTLQRVRWQSGFIAA